MDDFEIDGNNKMTINKLMEEGSLILVTSTPKQESVHFDTNNTIPNWTITPYDLGGHSPYFSSQKLFSSNSSFFFLIFSREHLKTKNELYPKIGVYLENILSVCDSSIIVPICTKVDNIDKVLNNETCEEIMEFCRKTIQEILQQSKIQKKVKWSNCLNKFRFVC